MDTIWSDRKSYKGYYLDDKKHWQGVWRKKSWNMRKW